MANASVMNKMVEIEIMSDEEARKKYNTSKTNARKVLRVLLLEELLEEQKEAEKEPESPETQGEDKPRRRRNKEEVPSTPEESQN